MADHELVRSDIETTHTASERVPSGNSAETLRTYAKSVGMTVEELLHDAPLKRQNEPPVDYDVLKAYFNGQLKCDLRDEVVHNVDHYQSWWIALRQMEVQDLKNIGE